MKDCGSKSGYMLWCIRKPAVIMIVGVNGGGKTTSLGKEIGINALEWEFK